MPVSTSDLKEMAKLGGTVGAVATELLGLREARPTPTTPPESPLRVGNCVFIRSITHHYTGRVEAILADEVVLSSAAWIASDGRFHDMLESGSPAEVEPYVGPVSIGRGAILDVTDWKHALPAVQK